MGLLEWSAQSRRVGWPTPAALAWAAAAVATILALAGAALAVPSRDNTSIAARLRLSQKTVRNNVSNILAKLQVADRAQAIVRARDVGLGQGFPHLIADISR